MFFENGTLFDVCISNSCFIKLMLLFVMIYFAYNLIADVTVPTIFKDDSRTPIQSNAPMAVADLDASGRVEPTAGRKLLPSANLEVLPPVDRKPELDSASPAIGSSSYIKYDPAADRTHVEFMTIGVTASQNQSGNAEWKRAFEEKAESGRSHLQEEKSIPKSLNFTEAGQFTGRPTDESFENSGNFCQYETGGSKLRSQAFMTLPMSKRPHFSSGNEGVVLKREERLYSSSLLVNGPLDFDSNEIVGLTSADDKTADSLRDSNLPHQNIGFSDPCATDMTSGPGVGNSSEAVFDGGEVTFSDGDLTDDAQNNE